MRRRHHHVADGVELAEHDFERRHAAYGADGEEAVLGTRSGERRDDEDGGREGKTAGRTHPFSVPDLRWTDERAGRALRPPRPGQMTRSLAADEQLEELMQAAECHGLV